MSHIEETIDISGCQIRLLRGGQPEAPLKEDLEAHIVRGCRVGGGVSVAGRSNARRSAKRCERQQRGESHDGRSQFEL